MSNVARKSKKSEYIQVTAALVLAALMIAPLLALAAQAYPTANDYTAFSNYLQFRAEGLSQLQSAFGELSILYSGGQGAFLSGLLAGLIVDTDIVPVFCCLIVGGFFIAVFIATKNVIRYIFGYHRLSTILWVFLGAAFLMTQFINPAEPFYWFSGTILYTLPVMSMFFGIAVALKSFRYRHPQIRFWQFIGAVALLFFACGGALVIGAFLLYLVLIGTVSAFLRKAACRKKALILLLACACGFLINALAPVFSGSPPPVSTPLPFFSGVDALCAVPPIVIATVLLFLLIPVANIAKHSACPFRHPLRCVIFSLIAILLLLLPAVLGYHHDMQQAYWATVTWFAIVLVLFNFIYLVGWCVKAHSFKIKSGFQTGIVIILALVSLAASAGIAKNGPLSYRIARDYAEGTIHLNRNETERVLDALHNPCGPVLRIKRASHPYAYLPEFVLSEDPSAWPNPHVARYYGIESVCYSPE